jgi:glycine/D-amino acid oxidase-like deaminating enzyme
MRAGLTLAPATADVIAGLLQQGDYDIDLACCRPGRDVLSPS